MLHLSTASHGGRWILLIDEQEQQFHTTNTAAPPSNSSSHHQSPLIIDDVVISSLLHCLRTYSLHSHRNGREHFSYQQIDLDIPRTFPTHAFFAAPDSIGQTELRRVLSAYVIWEDSTFATLNSKEEKEEEEEQVDGVATPPTCQCGYVQGMNMIAGHLLQHMDEAHAFHLLCHLMVNPKYNLQSILREGMKGLYDKLEVLNMLVHQHLPSVSKVLEQANVPLLFFCTEWVLTLFSYVFEGEFLNIFFDIFFQNGWIGFYRVALALMKSVEIDLVKASLGNVDDMQGKVLSIVKGIGRRATKYQGRGCSSSVADAADAAAGDMHIFVVAESFLINESDLVLLGSNVEERDK